MQRLCLAARSRSEIYGERDLYRHQFSNGRLSALLVFFSPSLPKNCKKNSLNIQKARNLRCERNKMKKSILLLCLFAIFSKCIATDYSKLDNWAALPTLQDNADWTPDGLEDGQATAKADVFFIHPTTDVTGFKGNANIDSKAINRQTDNYSIKYQASVFNGSCKVYAPRYRQAALHNFFTKNTDRAQGAFDTAYSDVKAAFEYYLKNYNHGRPIIIAGHSQGSMLAQRLLRAFFDGTPLQKQLVTAYIIGYPTHENQYQFLKPSSNATDIGGYISYCSFGQDSKINDISEEYNGAVVVNPLSWTTDKLFVSGIENKGSLSSKSNEIIHTNFGAKCGSGILEIQKPQEGNFIPMVFKNYHIFDYSLFYLNIRENVAARVAQYLKQNSIK